MNVNDEIVASCGNLWHWEVKMGSSPSYFFIVTAVAACLSMPVTGPASADDAIEAGAQKLLAECEKDSVSAFSQYGLWDCSCLVSEYRARATPQNSDVFSVILGVLNAGKCLDRGRIVTAFEKVCKDYNDYPWVAAGQAPKLNCKCYGDFMADKAMDDYKEWRQHSERAEKLGKNRCRL